MEIKVPKKLIEVALPLDAINAAAAREKSIRHGHPSTLHLWWARRPLAAARAVLFAQLVNDPGYERHLGRGVNKQKAEEERKRLFGIIERMILWENTNNEAVLAEAREEVRKSWRETCHLNRSHPQAASLFDPENLPAFHDPFAGGGAIPLEAQRLGLEAWASDLNPVAVLINKAMVEIPTRFAGRPPVSPLPGDAEDGLFGEDKAWSGSQGLAEDVRQYGKWVRDKAAQQLGHLYPKVEITEQMTAERPDLKPLMGQKLTVVAWLWTRTVKSPNPAFSHVDVPLASNFTLSTKAGKEAYIVPILDGDSYHFAVRVGKPPDPAAVKRGTKAGGSHSNFLCLMSNVPMPFDYLRSEAASHRLGARLMAIVAQGNRGRVYLAGTTELEEIAGSASPSWIPNIDICHWPGRTNVVEYGMTTFGDLFSPRQLTTLNTLSNRSRLSCCCSR